MENFTPTPYTLECVATGREFEDAGWMLADPQCKEPSLVRTKYARKQIDVKPADWGLYRFSDWMPVRRILKGSSAPVTYKSKGLAAHLGLENLWITFNGWYPAIGRDAIYREGPFVGYRYYETVGVPVRFPFGYGLSYSTFTYSAITATATGVDFVVTNDSDVAGSTVAQLYVRAPQGGVLHPDRELKGFVKVELAAHESKSVHIDFDRYTFRHFDVAANAWKTESGEWTLLVGDNAEHLPLAIPHTVAGDCTTADCAADPALGHYLTGRVKDVTDTEMAVLFGHEVLAHGKPTTFGVNDPIMSWVDSKGFVARTVAKTLTKREAKIRQKTGSPDLNTLFILNMPPRAMSKMTQGMVDSAMVDAIVNIANGHTFRGLGGVIAGFFRNQSANKRTAKELNHE